jgi:hypothetical protein
MERLGKNHGGYHGETIDIRAVLRRAEFFPLPAQAGKRVRVRGSIKIMPANLQLPASLQQKHPLENYDLLTPALSSFGEEREKIGKLEFFPATRILSV